MSSECRLPKFAFIISLACRPTSCHVGMAVQRGTLLYIARYRPTLQYMTTWLILNQWCMTCLVQLAIGRKLIRDVLPSHALPYGI